MRRQHFFISLAAILMLLMTSVVASAQVGELRGKVTLKQADGTQAPLSGAIVDVFRTDLKAKYETKTDSRGNFVFAGLPFIGTYIVAVSAPNARPSFLPNIKAGRGQDVNFALDPGDGKRASEEEVRAAAASGGGESSGGESAEDKAKRAELERKNAEIAASNVKAEAANAIYNRVAKEGGDAFKAKQYDVALAKYSEAITADPTHPGAPAIYTNRSIVLRVRAVDRYNAAVRAKDEAGKEAAKKDWADAVADAEKAVQMLKSQSAPADANAAAAYKDQLYRALIARAEGMKYFVSIVDKSKADAGVVAYQEYLAVETDPARKTKGETDSAKMLFDAGAFDKAIDAYQKVIATNPDNLDAMLYLGLALFNTGDKAKYQDAANYLQRFVDKAPDTHEIKASAKEALDYLKTQEKVTPKATTTTRRRG